MEHPLTTVIPNTAAMDRFAELVNEATKGEIKVEVFHGGVLGSQPDALEQVRIGAIEIGNFNLGPIGPMVKEANLVSLPFIFKSVPHMFRVLDGEAGAIMAKGMADAGVMPLAWVDAGARSFYSQKPINTPADVKGLKIRVMNNNLYTAMISAMGGNPSPMAFSEVQQALKTGVVDGAENNFPSFKNVGHYEVTTHYSLSEHLIIPECICVNTAKFNALSPELQAAVKGAAERQLCISANSGRFSRTRHARMLKKLASRSTKSLTRVRSRRQWTRSTKNTWLPIRICASWWKSQSRQSDI